MRSQRTLLLIAMVVVGSAALLANDSPQPRLSRLSLMEGDVTYQRSDLDRWIDLSVNTPLLEGDRVWVGDESRAEIEFDDGSTVRLGSNTILGLARMGSLDGPRTIELDLHRGRTSIQVRSDESEFKIQTPLFVAAARNAANLRLDVDPAATARLVVFDGSVEVQSQASHLFVSRGESVRFQADDPDRYYLAINYVEDEWDRWNADRDVWLAELRDRRTTEYVDGWSAADLNRYGTWYADPTYGSVWRPHAAADWAPFREGRWCWYDQFGWTWISYEPWGWWPYHYGRWNYFGHLGWAWVPGRRLDRWCPGAVGWIHGPTWVGWVPLAPFEPWQGLAVSVNVFASKNFRHRHGVSFLPHDSFLRDGRRDRNFRPPHDPLRNGGVVGGPPGLSPTLASRMPVAQSISRRYTNSDLEARRALREQLVESTVPAAAYSTSGPSGEPHSWVQQRRSMAPSGSPPSSGAGTSSRVTVISPSSVPSRSGDSTLPSATHRESVRESQQRVWRVQSGSNEGSSVLGGDRQRVWQTRVPTATAPARPLPSQSAPAAASEPGNRQMDQRGSIYRQASPWPSRTPPPSTHSNPRVSSPPPSYPAPPSYTPPRPQPAAPPSSRSVVNQSQGGRAGADSADRSARSAARGSANR
ncbi:MAG: DUF6600 domain-containing protein [Acidobacteriota bacterium]